MTLTPIHTLVHIGAGNGSQLPQYEAMAPVRLVLIEPLPSHAKALRQATANLANTEVWELAVSCIPSSEAKLTEYNLASASSLHPATGLNGLFPGIKVVQQHSVTTISPQTLIERLQLDPKQHNQLLIEANGEEQEILGSLLEHNYLTLFRYIQISMPDVPLYQSWYNPDELLSKLENHCFELRGTDNSDPDIPLWQLDLNPVKQDLKVTQSALQHANELNESLQQKLEALQQALKTEAEKREQAQLQANSSTQENDSQKVQYNQLSQQQKELLHQLKAETKEKEKIRQELKDSLHQLQQEKNRLAKANGVLTEYKDHAQELEKQTSELQLQLKSQRQGGEKAENQLEVTYQKLDDIKQQHQQLTQSQTELQKTLTTLNQQLQAEKQDKEQTQQQLNQSNAKVDQLKQTCDQLTKDNNTLKVKENLLLDLRKKHAELQQKHQKLLSEHQTTQSRQQLLESELLKAEAQIELIKELMLNGSAI
ncbi:hypothetical protein [Oceanimonas doudoroffii]|uniref:Methyltransferase FkbM domain-containing protein n=1 Tax=Oceanimonas doudoroffii TaxID=84158 RepID=A0A233RFG3_9GAMM|nr:hypothetical protein [Oceanimonas doudoroffii]OXY82119.1 hypothetical protein B6S08_00860 [Oceanimonas doudoroffii]